MHCYGKQRILSVRRRTLLGRERERRIMSYLPYPPRLVGYCKKYGKPHYNGALCDDCRRDAERMEQERLRKKAEAEKKARKRQEIWDSIIWLEEDDGDNRDE
jgi:hypothetical protein